MLLLYFICYLLYLSNVTSIQINMSEELLKRTFTKKTGDNAGKNVSFTSPPQISDTNHQVHESYQSNNNIFIQGRTLVPGGAYYEFFVNEASYKFWAVFQLVTVLILLYSAFAAIYFAKYTFLTEIENLKEEDLILRKSRRAFVDLHPTTFQRILDTVHPT